MDGQFADGATYPGLPARHAAADFAGPGLAGPGGRRGAPVDWSAAAAWTFEPLDDAAFPAVALAREAAAACGTMPAV